MRINANQLLRVLTSALISSSACFSGQPVAAAQPAPKGEKPDARAMIKDARDKRQQGLLDETLTIFEGVAEDANASPDDRGEAALEAAEIYLDAHPQVKRGSPDDTKVMHYYDLGDQSNDLRLRAIAKHNRGTFFLRRRGPGDLDLAADAFDAAEASATAIEDLRFLLEFNIGRLLVLRSELAASGSPGRATGTWNPPKETELPYDPPQSKSHEQFLIDEAFNWFVDSLGREPAFEPSSIEAFDILFRESTREQAIDRAIALALFLIEKGQPDLAMRRVVECLKIWGGRPEAYRFSTVLVRYYGVVHLSPDQLCTPMIPTRWRIEPQRRERVNKLAQSGSGVAPAALDRPATQRQFLTVLKESCPPLKSDVDDIEIVFEGDFRSGLDHTPRVQFARWVSSGGPRAAEPRRESEIRRRSFAAFLKMVGDSYVSLPPLQKGQSALRRALDRYEAAWVIDPANTSAALATVTLIRDRSLEEFNQEAYHRMLNLLFPHRLGQYSFSLQRDDDRLNLEQIHIVLHELNFSRSRPYPLPGGDEYDRRFHLQMALEAREHGLPHDGSSSLGSSAAVLRYLAQVDYIEHAPPGETWRRFVKAAEIDIATRRVADAAASLRQAERLPVRPSPEQSFRLYSDWAQVEELGRLLQVDPGPRRPAATKRRVKSGSRSPLAS